MKKILSLLALIVLSCMGAWAQKPTASPAPTDRDWAPGTKWYFINFANSDDYHVGSYLCTEGESYIDANGKLLLNGGKNNKPMTSAALWCFVGNDTEGYSIYNRKSGTEKKLSMTATEGKMLADGADGYTQLFDYTASGSTAVTNAATFKFHGTTNSYLNNQDGGTNNPDYLKVWADNRGLNDNGSAMVITEVTEEEFLLIEGIDVTYVLNNAFGEEIRVSAKGLVNHFAACPDIEFFTADRITDSDARITETNTTFHVEGNWDLPVEEGKYYTMKPADNAGNFVAHGTDYAICNNKQVVEGGNDIWQFEHVSGTQNLFKIKNYRYGYATAANSNNQTVLTYANEATAWESGNGVTSYFRITKNGTGFNIQHPGDEDANAGNHVSNKLGFWNHGSSSTANGSRIIVNELNIESEIAAAKAIATNFSSIAGVDAKTTATTALDNLSGTSVEKYIAIPGILATYYAAADGKKFTYESRMYNTTRYLKAANVAAELETSATDALIAKNVFEFEHVARNTFKVKVPYYNSYLNRYSTAASGSVYELLVFGENYVALQFAGEANGIHHQQTGNKPVSWGTSSDATKWYIAPITDEQYEALDNYVDFEVLQKNIDKVNSYAVGTGLNQYSYMVFGVNQNAEWENTLNWYRSVVNNGTATKDEVESYKTAVLGLIDNLVINQPKAGSFLRIRNANTRTYLSCNNNSGNTRVTFDNTVDNSKIFYFDGQHLLSYKTGMYVGQTGADNTKPFLVHKTDAANNTASTVFTFPGSPVNVGTYNVVYAGNRYLYDSGNAGSDAANNSDTKYTFWLEEVTSLPVTIASSGYSTFNSPVATAIPAGVKAYTAKVDVTDTTNPVIVYTKVEDVIPANSPVFLAGEAGAAVNFALDYTNQNAALDNNDFEGTVAAMALTQTTETTADKYYYVLSNGQFKFATTKINGFRAYLNIALPYSAAASSNFRVIFNDDFTTGIEAVDAIPASAEIFDLQGRRVNAARTGLYIVNGKKVIR